ncbi:MAG: site-specific integrase [Gammaproteobacteria bacterium]|nr:site-specific integrase [Gammaproteobacteria bacterium]
MGHKKMPGLTLRGGIWHINKQINGKRIYESTGTSDLLEAEKYLVHKLEIIRQAVIYGVRPKRTFREAALKFVQENNHKASIYDDVCTIKQLDPILGKLALEAVHMGSLQAFIEIKRQKGVKTRTINYGLQLVRHILNLAAGEWLDEHGLTWLSSAPKIKLLAETDKRKPYPLDWEEQERLFKELPSHLENMALFAVNTGCRDTEICRLRWDWEIPITGLGFSVFIIPGENVKNREDRLVVLNKAARSVIERVREQHAEYVFTYKGKPISRMLRSAWKKARLRAGLPQVRVHDLKHTFGRRLRAAGVSFEDRQDLLGHKSKRMTTHYSAAELSNLLEAAEKACAGKGRPVLTLLRRTEKEDDSRKSRVRIFGSFSETAEKP